MNEKQTLNRGYRLPWTSPSSLPEQVQALLDSAAGAQKRKPTFLGLMHVSGFENTRKVIECDGFNSAENASVVALYDSLVQNSHIRATRTVNVGLIVKEGFIAFEKSIGQEAWSYVKKYYGIGCEADTSCLTGEELKMYLAKMRTIENACSYIDGYWNIIQALHGCLDEYIPIDGIDERHQILAGAKISVLAMEVLCGDWFLHKQLKRNMRANRIEKFLPAWLPDYDLCHNKANHKEAYGPEDVIGIYERLKPYGPNCIIVEMVMREIWSLQQRGLIEEVTKFCELTFKDNGKEWNIISNNFPNPYNTIAKAMELKKRVHPERSVRAMEAFILKPCMENIVQTELWELYVILKYVFNNGKTLEEVFSRVNGGYFYANCIRERTTVFCLKRRNKKDLLISGVLEAERVLYLAKYIYANDTELPYSEKNKELRGPAGQVMMAITVLQKLGCKEAFYVEKAMQLAGQEILKMDRTGILKRCLNRFFNNEEEIKLHEIIAELGITPEHLKRWGANTAVVVKESTEEPASVTANEVESIDWCNSDAVVNWVIKWAIEKGYKVQNDAEQRKLICTILVDGNIDLIKALSTKELDDVAFMQEIGFDPVYADMYFARDQVDCEVLTAHLIKAAKQAKQKKNCAKTCTIKLYKYLVRNRLPCGPDMIVMPQNSTLKNFIK